MDKKYIYSLIEAGDRRSYNELAADLQLVRWTGKFNGKNWRYFEDLKRKDGKENGSEYNEVQGRQGEGSDLAEKTPSELPGLDT